MGKSAGQVRPDARGRVADDGAMLTQYLGMRRALLPPLDLLIDQPPGRTRCRPSLMGSRSALVL